ncbi:cupin domain-containing protein [Chitinophaga sp. GbtcB8]|uniref:cupin domain-containing protein n=1 Tax=Chitinophaga sp. GbtcB8 TaxID=2824753 RepID=UPI001C3106BD|nr:cupin domain-containing protein [Chitinophaga sp. GbtcB8]
MEKHIQPIIPMTVASSELTNETATYNLSKIFEDQALSDFNLIRFIVYPGQRSVEDQHRSREYWYIAKGEGRLTINGQDVIAKEGEVFFFNSLSTHQIINLSNDHNLEILSIWW